MSVCVDNYVVFKSNSGYLKKLRQLWKIDIDAVVKSLVNHKVVSLNDFESEDEVFYSIRNGYITLRRKKIPCLEKLLTSFKTRETIVWFCREFPVQAREFIIPKIMEKYVSS